MKVVIVASQKGGSGKTTLAGHLAVAAEMAGAGPVVLIDADPQGSLSDWWNERESDTPAFAHTSAANLSRDLETLQKQGFQYAVIDTPPAIVSAIQAIVMHSDLVVIPTRPSPHDLRAAAATVNIVERCGKRLVFVINAATARARLTAEAAVALSQHGMVAPVNVHNRVDFASSMIDGRTVMEIDPEGKSAKEVMELWEYVRTKAEYRANKTIFQGGLQSKSTPPPRKVFGRRVGDHRLDQPVDPVVKREDGIMEQAQ